jgi:peptidyl-tRNA hydrolase, PTH1 family
LKYLITGLGNIGEQYAHTRHNIGFDILDALARTSNISFEDKRYGSVTFLKFKGRYFYLLKPSTFVNLSGNAVDYWLKKLKILNENLLVIADDIALPFGVLRLKPNGGDAGHNGLFHISQVLGTNNYARLRFGIGNNYQSGRQVEYVLGNFSPEEQENLTSRIEKACEIIISFGLSGVELTMNQYNNK